MFNTSSKETNFVSFRIQSSIYLRSTTLGCKNISFRKISFSGRVAVFLMGGKGAGRGIDFDHVVSKERVKFVEK